MSVHATAPLRIDFAGGWTDAPRFAERQDGAAVTVAISLTVHADFLLGDRRIRLAAEDLDERVTIASSGWISYDGRLDLHKAALNMLPVTGGIEILTRSEAPVGSGLGTAGALEVALLGGLAQCRREPFDAEDLVAYAHQLEASELKWTGGRQDQYSAAFGGFQRVVFRKGGADRRPLDVPPERAALLASHLLLVFTGRSHLTEEVRRRVWDAYDRNDPAVTESLMALAELAAPVARALEAGDWEGLGGLVLMHWRHQQRLDAAIRSPRADAVERAVEGAGAWGWKGTGPGAGGCMAVVVPAARRATVEEAARDAGGEILPFAFASEGVQVWEREDAFRE